MNKIEINSIFLKIVEDDKNISNGIAAIKTLLVVLERTNCELFILFHHLT